MEIKLLEALDYKKIKNVLNEHITDEEKMNIILKKISDIEVARHAEIVSAAGRLSRFNGNTEEILNEQEKRDFQKNTKTARSILSMGHKSISEHDYLVFSIKNVSAIVEQTLIGERFSSFTIRSRREVDFSNSGFYIPNFYDKNGNLLKNNEELKRKYKDHMQYLFDNYSLLVKNNIKIEDARFILPYCYYSNIFMGINAHTLFDMIVKFTKTKYAKIKELKEFGDRLYEIAKENVPYLTKLIDDIEENYTDSISEFLDNKIKREPYQIIDQVKILNSSKNVDDIILISSIMRRYQYSFEKAKKVYNELCKDNPNLKLELMKKVAFEGDRLELSQVNFNLQIPISYAVLTHLTRHRTHKLMVPDFSPNIDLTKYKIPPKINDNYLDFYNEIFKKNKNKNTYDYFKSFGIRDEDLIYFILSGNMTNVTTNMDGWTVRHILELRECNKAQWEIQAIAYQIHKEINKLDGAYNFSKILGPTCITQGICNEGKESCGKIKKLS